jgi:diguanylate cyclase (GGDEF)-like protein
MNNFFPISLNKRKQGVLEFQSRLLKELSISANSIKTRESQIKNIVTAASDIMDLLFVYTFLHGEDDTYDLEFFWHKTPAPGLREHAVQTVMEKLTADPAIRPAPEFNIIHTTAHPALFPQEFTAGDLEVITQTFSLDAPETSGMVGICLKPARRRSAETRLAVENILDALINLVSSVKALATYTREVERFATRDPLTNLYNQIAFWDLLQYETERSKRQQYRFSLLVIDADNFKAVNDTYGHDVGDAFLRDIAMIIKNAVRGGDIAARYGGDQFTAILPVCDEGQAYIVAKRILENLREHSLVLPNGTQLKETVSIGVAVYPDHAKEAKDLYLLADSMLLQAKTFGKDRLSMPSEHDDVEVLKSMGEKNIMVIEALTHRNIVPYFQPIMNVQTMKIEAFEVLTRIVIGDRIIPAADFIETAEGMGAIGKIDYQLIELAFAKVQEHNYDGNLFLNLSPKALVLNEFMPTVRRLLKDYHIDPAKMVFEITERDTVKNSRLFESFVHDLKRDGFRFAIDDFGAGYSSFHYIKTFSIDFLKVDGEFIKNLAGDSRVEKAIVSSIASLAGDLGIKTIAEFVESEEILGQVTSAGINYAQGYYIKKPSPDLF